MSKKTKIEIIKETIKFYGDKPSRRAEHSHECRYYMKVDGEEKMCALGRCMINPKGCEKRHSGETPNSLGNRILSRILKPEYRGHDEGFWSDIQSLHDQDIYWNQRGRGMSEQGKLYVKRLLEHWKE